MPGFCDEITFCNGVFPVESSYVYLCCLTIRYCDMQHNSSLQPGSIIRGGKFTYTIQSVLGQGSFGITYLATTRTRLQGDLGNIETEVKVAVKEFFMHEFCSRHADGTVTEMSEGSLVSGYARKFRKEAENLARLSHPGIVRVLEVFEANNTCYYSMEYIDGGSLDAYVKQCGGLPEDEATECIRQIADALGYMHEHKMLHLDLKPLNVMRSADGSRLTLIDFGLSKQYDSNGEPESSTTVGLGTPGYAPIEQSKSDRDKEFAPTLDVYALGATFFKLLTGQTPPDASDVLDEGLPLEKLQNKGVSQTSIKAIERAMEPRKSKRIQSVVEFISLLPSETDEGTQPVTPKPAPKPAPHPQPTPQPQPQPAPAPKPKGFPKWLIGVLAGLAAIVAIVLFAGRSNSGPAPAAPAGKDTVRTEAATQQDKPEAQEPSRAQQSGQSAQTQQPAKPAVIALESITLGKTSLTLEEGATSTLSVKYSPSNATDKSTTWKSTDASVAKVSSTGKVTAVKSGSAAIIATCGGKDAYCNVTVKSKEVQPSAQTAPQSSSTSTASSPSAVSNSTTSTTGTHNGHEWVDLGLSVKWATCNVGASSPEDYGSYFAWGETSPKSEYTWANLKYCNDTTGDSFSKYNQNQGGTKDNRTVLDLSDDAARANWGGSWRMPTDAEFQELIDKCTWTWTTMNGKNGYKVVSKSNGNSIFLPAAGYRDGAYLLYNAGIGGHYWSSSLYTDYPDNACSLRFDSDYYFTYADYRCYGRAVRPVCR